MIYTVIADYRRLSFDAAVEGKLFSSLPENLRNYIMKPSSDEVKISRLGAYLLLYHSVRFLFGKEDFEISFTENGKPVFTSEGQSNRLSFNLSHSAGLCAVAVSDEGNCVGVDIQEKIDRERAERVKSRFMNYTVKGLSELESVYLFGAFSPVGNCMFAEIPDRSLAVGNIDEEPTDLWALTEAILKCDGGGFCKAEKIMADLSSYSSENVRLSYKGRIFSVSTVCK